MALNKVIPVSIYFDCAMFKQSGQEVPMGIGVAVKIKGEDKPQYSIAEFIGNGTVSQGEYVALYYAMRQAYKIIQYARAKGKENILVNIYGDSQFVINSFNGVCNTSAKFQYYKDKVNYYYDRIKPYVSGVVWVPREYNKEANTLSKKGIAHLYEAENLVYNPITDKYERINFK